MDFRRTGPSRVCRRLTLVLFDSAFLGIARLADASLCAADSSRGIYPEGLGILPRPFFWLGSPFYGKSADFPQGP